MGQSGRVTSLIKDDSGIVVGWLVKVSLILIIIGLTLFEIFAVVLVRATAADTASKAAQEAGFAYRNSQSLDRAEEVASRFAEGEGTEFVSVTVNDNERTITVTVRKEAKTLFIQNIGPLKKYTIVEASQTAPLPS